MKILRLFSPILFLFCVEVVLVCMNVTPHTTLLGWDGVYSQYNFPLNLLRNIVGVWQEYRGLGLLDGMSNTSNLLHTLFLWILSYIIPSEYLRYGFIFLMHFLGILGMYFLLKKLTVLPSLRSMPSALSPLLGALFYGLNFATIQMFYAPLEVFAIHFAVLPWACLVLFSYLKVPTKKQLFFFALVSCLASPQGFVPQIFISYCLLLGSILGIYLWINRKKSFKIIFLLIITIFCTNAFWLLPYLYGIPHNASIIMNAKINQIASPQMYQMNQNRGNFWDVVLLKGFMLDTMEFLPQGFSYSMSAWRDYTNSLFFLIPGCLFFCLAVVGIREMYKKHFKTLYPVFFVFVLTGFFLGNNIPGVSLLNNLLRLSLPLFNEAFRLPFTKFITVFVFCYSIFLAFGINSLIKKMRLLKLGSLMGFLFICLFVYSFPSFTGHFFYSGVKVSMPKDYQSTMNFFATRNPNARVATLPQPTFYNWQYLNNYYRGSGFLWYGLSQPLMDNSFDPWSNYNEQYYWELSQAVYSQNPHTLKNVLAKYQIQFVMLDGNYIYPSAPKSLQIPQTQHLLQQAGLRKIQTFGNIAIFTTSPQSWVMTGHNLPLVNSYHFTSTDTAYSQLGTYQSSLYALRAVPYAFFYPFRSLFTNREPWEKEFDISQNNTSLIFSHTIPTNISRLTIPSSSKADGFITAQIHLEKNPKGTYTIFSTFQSPTILLGKQILFEKSWSYPLFTLSKLSFPVTFSINGQTTFHLSSYQKILGTTLLPVDEDSFFSLTQNHQTRSSILSKESVANPVASSLTLSFPTTKQSTLLQVIVPKTTDTTFSFSPEFSTSTPTNCNAFGQGKVDAIVSNGLTLSAQQADSCVSFFNPYLPTNIGYAGFITHQHISGESLGLWMEDVGSEHAFSQINLSTSVLPTTESIILAPLEANNSGYSVHLDNPSLGNSPTQNILTNISFYPIPYNFLTQLVAKPTNQIIDSGQARITSPLSFSHPNPSFYSFTLPQTSHTMLILSQAYDTGWKAYAIDHIPSPIDYLFPFLFGVEEKNHVKINNWENGWNFQGSEINNSQSSIVNNKSSIILVYLPQYLEYVGFGILGGYTIFLFFLKKSS